MRIAYRRLVGVRVQHGFYANGRTNGDFEIAPTAATAALLTARGLRYRTEADGISVFGEIEPDSQPPELLHPLGKDALRFVFALKLVRKSLFTATAGADFRPGQSLLCFDNLREDTDVAADRAFLGDSVVGQRVGPASWLLTRPSFDYPLAAPVSAATVSVTDRFGALVATSSVVAPLGTTLTEVRLDLAALLGERRGRYALSDDHGGSLAVYYDPDLEASRPFGVIEVYSRTEPFTPDGMNRVPPAYRFLAGDVLTGQDTFHVGLEARATRWRYVVNKKYEHSGVELNGLSIQGPVTFAAPVISGTSAVFRAQTTLALSEDSRNFTLEFGGRAVRVLPEPDPATPLGREAATGDPLSDLFVNV